MASFTLRPAMARPVSILSGARRAGLSSGISQLAAVPAVVRPGAAVKVQAMRHAVRTNRLGRAADQRKALIRTLVTEVLRHGKIKTTVLRAKYIRKYVEKMITLSKEQTLHSRRQLESFLYDKDLAKSVYEEGPKRYADRQGGYTRVIKDVRPRRGDCADMATIELV